MKKERGEIPHHLKKDRDLSSLRHLETMMLSIIIGVGTVTGLYIALQGISLYTPIFIINPILILISAILVSMIYFLHSALTTKIKERIENLKSIMHVLFLIFIIYLPLQMSYITSFIYPTLSEILCFLTLIIIFFFYQINKIIKTFLEKHLKAKFPNIYQKEVTESWVYKRLKNLYDKSQSIFKELKRENIGEIIFIYFVLIFISGTVLTRLGYDKPSIVPILLILLFGFALIIKSLLN